MQSKRHDIEISLRGILRGFGLKVGKTTPRLFEGRIRELVEAQPTLGAIAEALLAARGVLARQLRGLEKRVRETARGDARTRLLMSTPRSRFFPFLTRERSFRARTRPHACGSAVLAILAKQGVQ